MAAAAAPGEEAKLPVFELGDVFLEAGPPTPEGDCSVREGTILEPRSVTVHAPEWRKSGLSGHHVYKITTAPSTVNHVYRRYSDFDWLRDVLCKIFPGVFVPPLPPKKVLNNKSDQFLTERRDGLQRFLNRCLMLPLLVRSAPFQTFLSRTQTFSEACKELSRNAGLSTGKVGKLVSGPGVGGSGEDAAEIVRQYKELFPEEMNAPLPENADQLILDLQQFLQATEGKLKALTDTCTAMYQSMVGISADLNKLQEQMARLRTAEKGYPNLPKPPRIDLQPQFAQWGQATAELSLPSFRSPLLKLFVYELADVRAFLELLRARAAVLARYNKAAKKAERWRNAPPQAAADEKQRAQKQLDLAREEEERDLLEALTKLLLGSQVRYLWTQKTAAFERAWARFANEQLKASQALAGCWEAAVDALNDPANMHPSPAQLMVADLEDQASRAISPGTTGVSGPQHYRNSDAVLGSDDDDDDSEEEAGAAIQSQPQIQPQQQQQQQHQPQEVHDAGFYGQEQSFGGAASDDDDGGQAGYGGASLKQDSDAELDENF